LAVIASANLAFDFSERVRERQEALREPHDLAAVPKYQAEAKACAREFAPSFVTCSTKTIQCAALPPS
jgi:hypothetical protein